MLSQYIDNLESTIHWACSRDDLDMFCLARERMDQLMAFVQTLPESEQIKAHQHINEVLPMEWPLWMEACRYEDRAAVVEPVTGQMLH